MDPRIEHVGKRLWAPLDLVRGQLRALCIAGFPATSNHRECRCLRGGAAAQSRMAFGY